MSINIKRFIVPTAMFLLLASSAQGGPGPGDAAVQINVGTLGFQVPTFSDLLTFLVKFFFVVAGLAALFFLLWGALSWVTSGGDKDNVAAARGKILAALVGVLVIIATLTIIWSLEQIVFKGKLCFGISCPVNLPTLLK